MIDKRVASVAAALADVADGATIAVAGFGVTGQPAALIDGLIAQGARDLTIVSNNAGIGRTGLAALLATGRVRRIICSFPRSSGSVVFEELYGAGRIELEIVPQGTLAERLRAAGAGIPAFFTRTSYGTRLAEGKETRSFNGHGYVMELALPVDVALIDGWAGDRWGNLTHRQSARNFNPVMATAAKCTIAQVAELRELGEIDPENVVTPGIFVHRLVHVPVEEISA